LSTALMCRPRRKIVDLSEERERAHSLAQECLLRARGRALFELLSGLSGAASPSDVRVGLRAAALVPEGVRLPHESTSSTDPFDGLENDGWKELA
jgi:hypothetical protein